MRIWNAVALILILVTAAFAAPAENGEVSLPWAEFRGLLELDKDEIVLSWEEFQLILKQTGWVHVPPFQLKQEKVVLSRKQFRDLLARMRAPEDKKLAPPADYLITRAGYSGRVLAGSVDIDAEFQLEIFAKDAPRYCSIPLFQQNIALRDALLDGKSALLTLQNGRYQLTTNVTGKHTLKVSFSLKPVADTGPQSLSFPIPRTPITRLSLDIPQTDIDVQVGQAQSLTVQPVRAATRVQALLLPCSEVSVSWRKQIPEQAKGPAKIYADTINHVIIEDDALRVNSIIRLSVLQNTISGLTLKVPEGYSILNVIGSGLGDWQEDEKDDMRILEVPFDYEQKGNFTVTIVSERILSESNITVGFNGFKVISAIRETGFIGIELKSTSEVTLAASEGIDRLDVSELPGELVNRSQKPLLYGFKYLHHPYNLVLAIEKHEELPIISTVIDSASGVTLFTEDGKVVHRIIYKVRNTSKQFLELTMPKDAVIWSVFVANEPAKPRLNESKVLIPLNRSRQGASGLVAFDVELIFYEKDVRFGRYGVKRSAFPVPNVIVSQMLWSVYLPLGYDYLLFSGTVEKEKGISGLRAVLSGDRKIYRMEKPGVPTSSSVDKITAKKEQQIDELRQQFSKNIGLDDSQMAAQVENEARFSARVEELQQGKVQAAGGVLPIRINVPTTGHLYRFAKTIVSNEPLTLSVTYSAHWLTVLTKALVLLLLVVGLYLLRKPLARLFSRFFTWLQVRHLIVLFCFAGLFFWSSSLILALLCFLIALLMLAYLALRSRHQEIAENYAPTEQSPGAVEEEE